jgi:hypothetical protein
MVLVYARAHYELDQLIRCGIKLESVKKYGDVENKPISGKKQKGLGFNSFEKWDPFSFFSEIIAFSTCLALSTNLGRMPHQFSSTCSQ